jgi:calcineurin-like phosphoesterase family protein
MRINSQKIYFTSDLHLGHKNVIKFDNRPFSSIEEMHDKLIENWNNKVPKDGIVFFLGDLFYKTNYKKAKEIVDKLNGDIYIIMGNHDRYKELVKLNRFKGIFGDNDCIGGLDISVKDDDVKNGWQNIVLFHYAILSWNKVHYGSWHLHGHSHQSLFKNPDMKWYYDKKVIDVGCNGWNYTPISYEEIKEIMKSKVIKSIDHH